MNTKYINIILGMYTIYLISKGANFQQKSWKILSVDNVEGCYDGLGVSESLDLNYERCWKIIWLMLLSIYWETYSGDF